jgi:hypothetical protein
MSLALAVAAAPPAATVPGGFSMRTRPISLPEQGKVTGYVVETAGKRFSFLPVPRWHVQSDATEKKVILVAPDLGTSLSFQIILRPSSSPADSGVNRKPGPPADPRANHRSGLSPDSPSNRRPDVPPGSQASLELSSDQLRALIKERYPTTRIRDEFPCFGGGVRGRAFDLVHPRPKGLSTSSRVAFIPFSEGLIEFKLTTPSRQFSDHRLALGNFMTSFRIEDLEPASATTDVGRKGE